MKPKITTVFIDMDETICGFKSQAAKESVESLCPLRSFFSAKNITFPEHINSEKDGNSFWPGGILKNCNLRYEEFWDFLVTHYRQWVFIYQDAINLLTTLKANPNIRVYPATTNPKVIILAKLALASMANQNASEYFNDLYGGEEVICGGKSSAVFYEALLTRSNSTPETTLMIGDHEKFDLQFAREAGISNVILPRRDQDEAIIHAHNDGIYVNSLEHIKEFLK